MLVATSEVTFGQAGFRSSLLLERAFGATVSVATTGHELLDSIAGEDNYDFIVTDISMPWMTGLQVDQDVIVRQSRADAVDDDRSRVSQRVLRRAMRQKRKRRLGP